MSALSKLTRRPLIAAAHVAVLLLGAFFAFAPEKEPPRRAATERLAPRTQAQKEPRAEPEETPTSRPTTVLVAAPPSVDSPPKDDLAIVGSHADDPHEPHMHPHPLTKEHERIHHENAMIQTLNDAMANRDTKRMRELLVEYKKLDPTDVHSGQRGYAVIADCIDSPGDVSLEAARRFYATERHSPLRRFVRRICFEGGN
jgi:hypothetical protein